MLLLAFTLSTLAVASAEPPAGCLIRHGEQALFVRDVWSRRYSLPGGGAEPGETPQQTAERETLEETGFRVTAGTTASINPYNGFVLLHCESKSPLPTELLPPLASRKEIQEIAWKKPSEIPLKNWRFRSQKESLEALVDRLAPGTQVVAPQSQPITETEAMELRWIRAVQGDREPIRIALIQFFSSLGGVFFLVLLLPYLLLSTRPVAAREASFLFITASTANLFLKEFFLWPRPLHLDPTIALAEATGLGFPSGHTTIATVLFGFLALRSRLPFHGAFLLPLPLLVGLGRIGLGVHFPHDVAGGLVLGLLVLGTYEVALRLLRQKVLPVRLWAAIAGTAATSALIFHFSPETVATVAAFAGMGFGILSTRKKVEGTSRSTSWGRRESMTYVLSISSLGAVFALGSGLFPAEASFPASLAHLTFLYLLVGFVWVAIPRSYRRRIKT